jgi:hypothetical protein
MVNFSKELYRTSAACASYSTAGEQEHPVIMEVCNVTSTVANSANPYRQLSLVRLSRTSRTRRMEPSFAPRFVSPVVEATLNPFFAAGGACVPPADL